MSYDPPMSNDEFRRAGHEMIDWIADYWETVEDRPVLSQVGPGDIRASLPAKPPSAPETWADIMADVDELIMPGHHSLAVAELFRLLPRKRLTSLGAG